METKYDVSDGSVKYFSWSVKENFIPKMVFSFNFSKKYLFNAFSIDDFRNTIEANQQYLPDLGWYEYDKYKNMLKFNISTNKALDLVKNHLNLNMEKVNISWTTETKAKYSSLVFYTVPDYYYQSSNQKLYYWKYDNEKNVHTIILSDDKGNPTFYDVDDGTGNVKVE
ncbi:MAG: hypothetical protein PHI32_12070 [Dysgonamonadaceae bacterium]|nr:hypothetical protein [Dysgonamonadaceae bacterium]